MNLRLSEHFALAEMVRSQTALRRGIANQPNEEVLINLRTLCVTLLEPVRALLGVPIQITSGYRSPLLNRAVGGAMNSAHTDGLAADIIPVGMELREAFDKIRASEISYDQIILECDAWIHIALPRHDREPRRQALLAEGRPGAWRYTLAPKLEAA